MIFKFMLNFNILIISESKVDSAVTKMHHNVNGCKIFGCSLSKFDGGLILYVNEGTENIF